MDLHPCPSGRGAASRVHRPTGARRCYGNPGHNARNDETFPPGLFDRDRRPSNPAFFEGTATTSREERRPLRIRTIATYGWRGWALLAVLATSAVRADLVYFARGGRVQLATNPATDGGLALDTPYGPFEFARTDFRKVVPD